MNAIILLGAPGSGKGTVAEKVRDACGYIHVSTGDMLRESIKQGTETGRQAEGYMKRGELVPDALIIKLVEERMDNGKKDAKYMFDGFPRTTAQAELLQQSLVRRKGRLQKVFFLDAPRKVLLDRLTGRRVCRKCGTCFHVVNIQPKRPGVCDVCGGELYQRPDDQEVTIMNRLEVFNRQTESLIAYYEKKGVLERVDSDRKADVTISDMISRVKALSAQ